MWVFSSGWGNCYSVRSGERGVVNIPNASGETHLFLVLYKHHAAVFLNMQPSVILPRIYTLATCWILIKLREVKKNLRITSNGSVCLSIRHLIRSQILFIHLFIRLFYSRIDAFFSLNLVIRTCWLRNAYACMKMMISLGFFAHEIVGGVVCKFER